MTRDTDLRQRFVFPDSDIRGEILRLESSLAPVLQARDYPMQVAGLLGETLAASALLTGTLKFEGKLSIQAQGSGPVPLLLAEATDLGTLRGLARWRKDELGEQQSLPDLLGQGTLAITIMPARGRQYQGLVPLEADSLAGCLEGYFRQSEQLPTRIWLACGNGRAAGLMLQALPAQTASEEHNRGTWETVTALADTLTLEELLDLPVDTVLYRLFHETPPQLPPAQPLQFACSCSREKVRNALISLGSDELQSILDEQGEARVSCDFCGSEEVFDAVDLGQMVKGPGSDV